VIEKLPGSGEKGCGRRRVTNAADALLLDFLLQKDEAEKTACSHAFSITSVRAGSGMIEGFREEKKVLLLDEKTPTTEGGKYRIK